MDTPQCWSTNRLDFFCPPLKPSELNLEIKLLLLNAKMLILLFISYRIMHLPPLPSNPGLERQVGNLTCSSTEGFLNIKPLMVFQPYSFMFSPLLLLFTRTLDLSGESLFKGSTPLDLQNHGGQGCFQSQSTVTDPPPLADSVWAGVCVCACVRACACVWVNTPFVSCEAAVVTKDEAWTSSWSVTSSHNRWPLA